MTDNIYNHRLAVLAEAAGALEVSGARADETPATSLTADSRQVTPGGMFVAVRGVHVDGHKFIAAAVAAGARAVVCEDVPDDASADVSWIRVADASVALGLLASQWHGNPSRRLTLVGVTGTNGKTTIATLLYEMARLTGHKAGLLSTVVNKIDDTEVPSTHTTPDPLELNALLARMVDAGCEFAAMEVSSHAAAQHRIAGLDFDGGIFTNLTRDHLDYHGTFANYLQAKQSFFDSLKPEAFALTNLDDRNGEIMLQNTRARRHTYSLRSDADFRGRVIEDRLDGMLLSLNGVEVETMFAGRFNAANLTAVYGATILLGVERMEALTAMSRLVPVSGRFQPVVSADGVTAIIDYAHTPDALVNVLDTVNEVKRPGSRVITICGAGGDRDRGKRPIMAAEAARRSWRVILTSDNPRSEDPASIIAEMRTGLDEDGQARTLGIVDRREAIRCASWLAAPGDVIMVAGKGHETYQIVGDRTLHFDDHEEVAAAFDERKGLR
ncbi:MAG: UDP-N-acetylmuramoyl-L-alanyl-D-glutamate--2,6-diaminopimelate ligase [Bacteroidales bacterium]|nr:UDP-N-acetylmuramoyl-L-alanyl-D-glutamate--2,6-diaminopimelate ligase [Bacteroidales bacterium]